MAWPMAAAEWEPRDPPLDSQELAYPCFGLQHICYARLRHSSETAAAYISQPHTIPMLWYLHTKAGRHSSGRRNFKGQFVQE